ncbi:MAG TPA: phosphoglucosamine mutase [Vicinamibacterales bacterium]|nr:phosphoglucosamine mutase [Vicinamibacterales bacterium]HPK70521.1 phosphoglucosamine mutase [Vicinamibacterales bacterium]
MRPLKIGISGVRGIVGESLTPELIVSFAQGFGTYLDSGRILVCRDTRASGPMVHAAVVSGLLAAGCEVVDLGVCPTPSLQHAVPWLGAQGGISISAGHNPSVWNALKFVRNDGLYLNAAQAEELLDIVHQGEFEKAAWDRIRTGVPVQDAVGHHLEVLSGAFNLDAALRRALKVAVDCCNGASTFLSPRWLEALGCEVLAINDDPEAPFPHRPEPKPEMMAQLKAVVRAGRADLGFAHDADGERIGLVTGDGEALSEERTLTLAAAIALSHTPGVVVTNISTTRAVDDVAGRFGGSVVRTPVGQSFITEAMIEHRAVLGGEGNGAVAVPRVLMSHDAAATQGLVVEHMAVTGASLRELVDALPCYEMVKRDFALAPGALYSRLQDFRDRIEREGLPANTIDGAVVSFTDGWVHVRASQTESMIRVIAEAASRERAQDLVDWARDRLGTGG